MNERDPDALTLRFRNNWREIRSVTPSRTQDFFTRTGRVLTRSLAVIEMETSGFHLDATHSGFIMLTLPETSGITLKRGRSEWEAVRGAAHLSDGRPFKAHYAPGYRGHTILLEQRAFREAAEAYADELLPSPAGHSALFEQRELRGLRAEIDALEHEVRHGGFIAGIDASARELETRFMMALLSGPLGRGLQRASVSQAGKTSLQRATEFIRANYAEPFRAQELARASGANLRALQAAFRHVYGASPWQYLLMCRLEAARRALSNRRKATSVTQAAIDAGFTHLGEFGRLYRQRFGERPLDTRKRTRCS